MKKIVLCGGSRRCCPEVNIGTENVTISDDYGGNVSLTYDEFELLKWKIMEKEL